MFGLQDWRLSHRIGHRHATASTALKVLERNHALLNQQGGDACEHPLVIAGVAIPGWLHPLDGMAIGVNFVSTELSDRENVESPRQPFPGLVEHGLVHFARHLAEAGLPA